MSLERLQQELGSLRADARIPEALQKAFADYPDQQTFLKHFGQLVACERAGDFKRPDHFKRNREHRSFFHMRESRLSSELLGVAFPPVGQIGESGPLGAYDAAQVEAAVGGLERDGYYMWPNRLSDAQCEGLLAILGRQPFIERATGKTVDGYHAEAALDHDSNVIDIASQAEAALLPEFQALAFDPMIVDLIQRYFGCCPIHTQVHPWWSIGAHRDRKSLSQSAQMFHQDKDYVRFVKMFLYLTDVDEDTGPHVYVAGSHRDYQQRFAAAEPFSKRFDDTEIADIFGADRIRPLTGKRGTLFFADTSGIHKGAPVLRDHRLLLQLEWTCSLFLSPQPPLTEVGLPEASQALRAAHPRLFAHYDGAALEAWRREEAKAPKKKGLIGRLSNSIRKRLPI